MKTITLKVVLPEWATWLGTDSDGKTWAYQSKPDEGIGRWLISSGWAEPIANTIEPKDFTKTLRRIK